MLTATPESDDFIKTGLTLFNFAWDTVATLITDLDDSEFFGVDVHEVSDAFWLSSKQKLSTSLAVAQQGIEFVLKGKIAEVSPFLLIAGGPNEWPKKCDKNDTNFADFRKKQWDRLKTFRSKKQSARKAPFSRILRGRRFLMTFFQQIKLRGLEISLFNGIRTQVSGG